MKVKQAMTKNKVDKLGKSIDLTELSKTIDTFKTALFDVITGKHSPDKEDVPPNIRPLMGIMESALSNFDHYTFLVDNFILDKGASFGLPGIRRDTRKQLDEVKTAIEKDAVDTCNRIQQLKDENKAFLGEVRRCNNERVLALRDRDKWKSKFEELQSALYDYLPEAEAQTDNDAREAYLQKVFEPLSTSIQADIKRRIGDAERDKTLMSVGEEEERELLERDFADIEDSLKELRVFVENNVPSMSPIQVFVNKNCLDIKCALKVIKSRMLYKNAMKDISDD